jgi:tetratricopeptide (TPR) repeat protein
MGRIRLTVPKITSENEASSGEKEKSESKQVSVSPYVIMLSASAIASNIKGLLPFFSISEPVEQIATVIFFLSIPVIAIRSSFTLWRSSNRPAGTLFVSKIAILLTVAACGTGMLVFHSIKLSNYLWFNERKVRLTLAKSVTAARNLEHDHVSTYLEEAKSLAKETYDKKAQAYVALIVLENYQQKNLLDTTSSEFKESEQLVRQVKDYNLLAWFLLLKAEALSRNGKGEEAKAIVSEIDIAKTGAAAVPWILAQKAKILRRNHDIKGSVSKYSESLQAICSDTPQWKQNLVCGKTLGIRDSWPKETSEDFIGTVSFAMAQALWEDNQRDEAVSSLKRLLASNTSEAIKVSLLINLAVFEWRLAKFQDAYQTFAKADTLSIKTPIPPDKKSFIHANWAGAMLDQFEHEKRSPANSDLAEIEDHLTKSMAAVEGTASHDRKAKFETLKNRLRLRLIQGRIMDALSDARETEEIVLKSSGMDPDAVGNFYASLVKLATRINDASLALRAKNHAAFWYYRGDEIEKAVAYQR